MLINGRHRKGFLSLAFAACAMMLCAGSIQAETLEASDFPSAKADRLMGQWIITLKFQGKKVRMSLNFEDVNGKLRATLQSPEQMQPHVITDITEISRGVKMHYGTTFGETEVGMNLEVRAERGTLNGTLSDDLGMFTTDISGERGGKIPGRALLSLGGKDIKIIYTDLDIESEDYERLQNVKNGEVFEFVTTRATKLFTDSDLKFGDVIVKAGNQGENYPGVYSLWLRRDGRNKWSLVFNEEADIWGTMHNPEADVAVVPLKKAKADSKEDTLVVDLIENAGGGVLRLAWGTDEWTADFSMVR